MKDDDELCCMWECLSLYSLMGTNRGSKNALKGNRELYGSEQTRSPHPQGRERGRSFGPSGNEDR